MASVYKKDKKKKGSPWYIAYVDENGKRNVVRGCPDRSATEQIARKLESEVELRRRGIVDPKADRHSEAEQEGALEDERHRLRPEALEGLEGPAQRGLQRFQDEVEGEDHDREQGDVRVSRAPEGQAEDEGQHDQEQVGTDVSGHGSVSLPIRK